MHQLSLLWIWDHRWRTLRRSLKPAQAHLRDTVHTDQSAPRINPTDLYCCLPLYLGSWVLNILLWSNILYCFYCSSLQRVLYYYTPTPCKYSPVLFRTEWNLHYKNLYTDVPWCLRALQQKSGLIHCPNEFQNHSIIKDIDKNLIRSCILCQIMGHWPQSTLSF